MIFVDIIDTKTAVRYGRVPKRTRELSGNDDSSMTARITAHNNTSTPATPVTPTTPQLYSVATPPDITIDPSELPSTTDLSTVYDVICRVSQAHRTHSTYTEENVPNILRKPIQLPDDALLDADFEVTFLFVYQFRTLFSADFSIFCIYFHR